MKSRPLLISLGMHALFAVIAVFGLPMLGRDLPEEMPIVRLEIVRTVPETNLIEGDKPSTGSSVSTGVIGTLPAFGNTVTSAGGVAGSLAGTVGNDGAMTITAGGAGTRVTGQYVSDLTISN